MPKTLVEKIWDAHVVLPRQDHNELVYLDPHPF
jgi:hypothetical protein